MPESNSTNPLQTVADVATIANYFQLYSIKDKILGIEQSVTQSAIIEEQQTIFREIIFQFNNFLVTESKNIKDKLVIATALFSIKQLISDSGLKSSSFNQITDKQYFQETVNTIDSQLTEYQSHMSEAKIICNIYRLFTIFTNIANKPSSIKILINKLNNFSRNIVIAFITGFLLTNIILSIAFMAQERSDEIQLGPLSIAGLIAGSVMIVFPILARMDNKEKLNKSMQELQPYLVLADVKQSAGNILKILDTFSHKVENIKKKIDKYEEEHPELKAIKKFL